MTEDDDEHAEIVAVLLRRDDHEELLKVIERQHRQTRDPVLRRLYKRIKAAKIVPAKWTCAAPPSLPEPASRLSPLSTSTVERSASSTAAEVSPTPSAGSTMLAIGSEVALHPMVSDSNPTARFEQAAFDFFEGIG